MQSIAPHEIVLPCWCSSGARERSTTTKLNIVILRATTPRSTVPSRLSGSPTATCTGTRPRGRTPSMRGPEPCCDAGNSFSGRIMKYDWPPPPPSKEGIGAVLFAAAFLAFATFALGMAVASRLPIANGVWYIATPLLAASIGTAVGISGARLTRRRPAAWARWLSAGDPRAHPFKSHAELVAAGGTTDLLEPVETCPICGYDLCATGTIRCPECGLGRASA
jgi:hypothetical protein